MDRSKRLLPSPGSDDTGASSNMDAFRTTWPRPWGLEGFYAAPASSDPWVPGLRTKPDAYHDMGRGIPTAYPVSRSNMPYDCGGMPPPSDSGYSSRAKHSITDRSVYDGVDRSQDTQSLTGHLSDFHPFASISPEQYGQGTNSQREYSHGSWTNQPVHLPSRSQPEPSPSGFVCPTCHQRVKNKSEIKKHEQRHAKPHKCDIPGCQRKEGFSTVNDLDRHKKSVHSIEGIRYQCRIGPCSTKDKTWPRADNFRSHLKRVHGRVVAADGDLSEYLFVPPTAIVSQPPSLEGVGDFANYTVDYAIMGTSYWSGQRPSQIDVPPQQDLDMSETSPIPLSATFPGPRSHDIVNEHSRVIPRPDQCDVPSLGAVGATLMQSTPHVAATRDAGSFREDRFSGPVMLEPEPLTENAGCVQSLEIDMMSNAVSEDDCATGQSKGPLPEAESPRPASIDSRKEAPSPIPNMNKGVRMVEEYAESVSSQPEDEDQDECEEEERKPLRRSQSPVKDEASLLKLLESVPEELLNKFIKDRKLQASKKSVPAPATTATDQSKYICAHAACEKAFPRLCELKKHQKRHEKPYGCTFPKCPKSFGSKNDWKRHENSQHVQLETWKCHEVVRESDRTTCGKVFPRREQFKHHLQTHHDVQDHQRLEKELHERRIGRDCDSSFWCGFCAQIISITSKNVHAWTERFNHIDNHFCGKNQQARRTIAEWKHIDDSEARDTSPASSTKGSPAEGATTETEPPRPRKKRSANDDPPPRPKRQRSEACVPALFHNTLAQSSAAPRDK